MLGIISVGLGAKFVCTLSNIRRTRLAVQPGPQPKVDIESRRIVGVEALIRWQSPELGLVPPAQFIGLLEETGLIVQVGAWLLRNGLPATPA